MKTHHTCILLVALAAGFMFAQQPAPPAAAVGPLGVRVDEYVSRLVPFGFSGAVLVAQDGKVALEKGYGLANREKHVPYAADTVSTIGSITKMFTAAAILKLEVQGRLHVEDPIAKYLPDVPPDKAAITIHQLLTHTGGLRADYGGRDSDPISRDELVKLVLTTPLVSAPGARFEYSNEGYSLLGAIVERVSEQRYEQYLRENILKPAGMLDTGYVLPSWNADRLAHGYMEGRDWGTMPEKGWREDGPGWYLKANGGLHSTVGDLYKWHLALDRSAVLSATAREKYTKPYVAEGPRARSFYAYGWAVFTTPRQTKLVAHNGGNGVFAADFRRYIDEKTVLIAMSNAEVTATDVTQVLDAVIFGQPFVMPPSVTTLPPEALARLAGTYRFPSGATIDVSVDGDALLIASDDPESFRVLNFLDLPRSVPSEAESRTRSIVEAGAIGDFETVRKAMGGDRPIERIRQNQGAVWTRWRERIGEFQRVEIMGSGRSGPGDSVFVRVVGERGSQLVQFAWEAGEMMMMRPFDQLPATRMLPGGQTDFAAFRVPRFARAHFWLGSADAPGSVMLNGSGGGSLRATKVK